MCFPEKFQDSQTRNVAIMMRDQIIASCNYILTDGKQSYLDTIKSINDYFITLTRPKNLDFGSPNSIAVLYEMEFEQLCVALQIKGIDQPKKLNVIEFYSTMKYLEAANTPKTNTKTQPR